jgi:Zn ribbon nucleic-acid-binding protein
MLCPKCGFKDFKKPKISYMKCKNCGYEENKKPKADNKQVRINLLIDLYKLYKLNDYNGKMTIKDIWEDLKVKLLNYECNEKNNNITMKTIINKLDKPPNRTIIDLLEELN